MPEHGAISYTCDYTANKTHRGCVAETTVRPDTLWLNPRDQVPDGWRREAGGHLCPDHADAVGQGKGRRATIVYESSPEHPAREVAS
ncbi:MAG: hypothetical protein RR101_14245 [Burkholderiaceae bacterium]